MRRWSVIGFWALILCCAAVFVRPAAAGTECVAAPPPIVALAYGSRYVDFDPQRATLDPFRDAAVDAALAPLEAFIEDLAERTGNLHRLPPDQSVTSATCILDHLAKWAEADALSDLGSETARLTVGARIAAFALISWQAGAYVPGHSERQPIVDWLERLQTRQIAFWADAPPGARLGNLRAWAALAAAAVAIQTDRPDFTGWSRASLEEILCTADPSGSLPQEMSRGRYALHYQLHAVAPLVTASLLLEQQAVPIQGVCDRALHRVVAFTVTDLLSGEKTQALTGVTQTMTDEGSRIEGYQLAWLEPYLALIPSEPLDAALQPLRPLSYSKLGGNQTALWAR